MPKKPKWITFFFDGNSWFDVVESRDKFKDLLSVHDGKLDQLLSTKRSVKSEEKENVNKMPRFGNRREHIDGKQTPLVSGLKKTKSVLGL